MTIEEAKKIDIWHPWMYAEFHDSNPDLSWEEISEITRTPDWWIKDIIYEC
mgnify:CR=1 FL=1|jgi:hypothetical protein|tara:strand:+ start:234 stop:386 length:153 start_codon:yes stop_codon:yes gene_type:complete